MIGIQLQAVDTWFFRDGTPFTKESAPQENVRSLFPPHPPTVVGALRAASARTNGWDGVGLWPQAIRDVLGDGPDDLGALSFSGPFLLRDGQPLFRAPRHLLGISDNGQWKPSAFLRPGSHVACDLGAAVRLPEFSAANGDVGKLTPGDDMWLTVAGMNAVLGGEIPHRDELVSRKCLWADEPRIGLQREAGTRTAEEGMLYSTQHVRLRRGVSLGMRIAGLPSDWERAGLTDQLQPLGGESRLAECQEWRSELALAAPIDQIRDTGNVALIALTPLDIDAEVCAEKKPLDALGGARVVSACLDRPQRIGGWDSQAHRPLPVRSVLAPGSVLFCDLPDPTGFATAVADGAGLVRIGLRQAWGFGLVAVGLWRE